MSRIISFRGLLAKDAMDKLNLQTIQGLIGYKITKFEIIPALPYQATGEHIVKIYKVQQSAASASIDFSDNTLLAAGIINNDSAGYRYNSTSTIIFDNEKFNQNIYVTAALSDGTSAINYYIELEQMALNKNESTVATLKDIRNND